MPIFKQNKKNNNKMPIKNTYTIQNIHIKARATNSIKKNHQFH